MIFRLMLPYIGFFLLYFPFGSFTLDRQEREKLAVPSHLLPSLVAVLGPFGCCHLRLGGRCRAVPVVPLLCSVAVRAFLPHTPHPVSAQP